jgi:two-component system sensor histidine kinase KdpD
MEGMDMNSEEDFLPRRDYVLVASDESPALQYWYSLWIVGALAFLGVLAQFAVGYHAVGFIFLCGVLSLGLFYSFGPVFFAAVLSGLVWDYFFIPPRFTFHVDTGEDALMIVALVLSSAITGLLTRQIRSDQAKLAQRERATQLLYDLSAAFSSGSQEKNLGDAEAVLSRAFGRDFVIYPDKRPRGRQAPSENFLSLPLLGSRGAHGMLACRLDPARPLAPGEKELLERACRRLGLALEREALERKSREADLLLESEQLHQTLLNSISHELRTPLTALLGSAAALKDGSVFADAAARASLLDEISGAGERLNRVIENLLDMARLSSGVLALKKEWQDPAELARLTAERLKRPLAGHTLQLSLPEGLPLILVDYRLIEHALSNLLLNAAAYAPAGSAISLSARAQDGALEFHVGDRGQGIPLESLPRLFDKFYRVPGSPAGGTGLGLYITQSLMQAHGGSAAAFNRPEGGAEFVLSLPLQPQPALPAEIA